MQSTHCWIMFSWNHKQKVRQRGWKGSLMKRRFGLLWKWKGMNGDKALGPNGITITFFQASWEIVKDDVMRVLHQFRGQRTFEQSFYPQENRRIWREEWFISYIYIWDKNAAMTNYMSTKNGFFWECGAYPITCQY